MPAKGRRVASRQAQLGRRRRRAARVADDTSPVAAVAVDDEAAPGNTAVTAQPPAAEGTAAAPVSGAPAPARATAPGRAVRNQTRNRADLPLAYTHLSSELRRILIMAGVLLVVLVVLAVVL